MNPFKSLVFALLCGAMLTVAHAEMVDINSANAEELASSITGIGQSRAEAIVEFRKENGPFSSVDDLVLVRGIGSATLEKNRDRLTVGR